MAILPVLAAISTIGSSVVGIASSFNSPPKPPPAPPPVVIPDQNIIGNRSGEDERRRQAAKQGRASTILTGASELLDLADEESEGLGG